MLKFTGMAPGEVRSELGKSETRKGNFIPISETTPRQRRQLRQTIATGATRSRPNSETNRSLRVVYANHGIGSSEVFHRDVHKPTTKSTVHPNLEFGPSMTPKHIKAVESQVNPAMLRRLKRPVVFHRDKDMLQDGSAAAAAPAHVTTGGKAHVAYSPRALKAFGGGLLDHEIAHTTPKSNPGSERSTRSTLGEEGRADALSGAHAYTRTGNVQRGAHVRGGLKAGHQETHDWLEAGFGNHSRTGVRELREGIQAQAHYHRVMRAVYGAARKVR